MTMHTQMAEILHDAYAHPAQPGVYYAGWDTTGSDRLNRLGRWDWRPSAQRGVDNAGTILFPLALGCPPRETSDGRRWIEKIISSPDQAVNFTPPNVHTGYAGDVLRRLTTLRAELPDDVLLSDPDTQSPLGVAELLWDDSFYTALLETPAAVHALLDRITDFIIAFVQEVQQIAGERFNPCGWPGLWAQGRGTMVADDTMSLISPVLHAEFSLPYLNRLARACGPLFYHSCTWRHSYFANIHAVEHVVAYNWNPGNSDDSALIMREFGGKAVLAPHLCAEMHQDNDVLALDQHFADEADFFRYLLDNVPANACAYFYFSDVCQKGDIIDRIYDLLHERGYTPQARGVA